jgi:arylsulfatase A-like enzyme
LTSEFIAIAWRTPHQYFEMLGNRTIYHDGWSAATTPPAAPWILGVAKLPDINDYKWETLQHRRRLFRV